MSIALPDIGPLKMLDDRNKQASEVIAAIAKKHAYIDAATGAASTLVPLVGPAAAFGGQMAYQIKFVWPDMINRLAFIYGAEPDQVLSRRANLMAFGESAAQFAVNELIAVAAGDLIAGLGSEFVMEIAAELGMEFGVGLMAGLVPFIGMGIAAFTDAAIAITMTWRVGAMAALYLQHGEFIGTRKDTYLLVRRQLVPFVDVPTRSELTGLRTKKKVADAVRLWASENTNRPGTLDDIRGIATIRSEMVRKTREQARVLLLGIPDREQVRRILTTRGEQGVGIPKDIVDLAMQGL